MAYILHCNTSNVVELCKRFSAAAAAASFLFLFFFYRNKWELQAWLDWLIGFFFVFFLFVAHAITIANSCCLFWLQFQTTTNNPQFLFLLGFYLFYLQQPKLMYSWFFVTIMKIYFFFRYLWEYIQYQHKFYVCLVIFYIIVAVVICRLPKDILLSCCSLAEGTIEV